MSHEFLAGSKVGSSPLASIPGVRSRHFSAPSGQGTPQSLASTIPQTPSVVSSHGSGTSDGNVALFSSDSDFMVLSPYCFLSSTFTILSPYYSLSH